MPNEAAQQGSDAVAWQSKQVYVMAVVCLVIGLASGYLLRGSRSTAFALPDVRQTSGPAGGMAGGMGGEMPSLEQMKQMSDMKAAPLLEKLKSDPKNSSLLIQVGSLYQASHQFKEAAAYYDKALKIDPKNVALRTEFASCLYYDGRVDEAIQQLNQSLQYSPNDATSLFNLGAIKWREKHDAAGALATWQQLLKTNPQLDADRKANVEHLMQEVKQHMAGNTERGPAFAGPVKGAKTQ